MQELYRIRSTKNALRVKLPGETYECAGKAMPEFCSDPFLRDNRGCLDCGAMDAIQKILSENIEVSGFEIIILKSISGKL